jgi:alkylation response protein AidB-like acyl-CoA dehydrogenase
LVDVKVQAAAARALLYENAWALDRGEHTGAGGPAAVKLLAAETTMGGALKIVDVLGRRAASEGLPFAGRLRDALGGPLYSGTSQMMRRMVARDMGL